MKKLLFLFIITSFFACSDNNIDPVIPFSINLNDLQSGQHSKFVRYESQCTENFIYTGDTLQLSVKLSNGQLIFEEKFTEGSLGFQGIAPVKYPVYKHDGFIRIPDRENSALFFFYGNDTIRVIKDADVSLNQQECHLYIDDDLFIGEEIAFVEEFEIGPLTYNRLKVVSCVPMWIPDLDAYIFYDQKNLVGSHTISKYWYSRSFGWKMIE